MEWLVVRLARLSLGRNVSDQINSSGLLIKITEGSHNNDPGMARLERGRGTIRVDELDWPAEAGFLLIVAGARAPLDLIHQPIAEQEGIAGVALIQMNIQIGG